MGRGMNAPNPTEIETLKSALFETITADESEELQRAITRVTVPPRTVILRQGDAADQLYIIHSGRVRVFRKDPSGVDVELSRMGPGETFGEMALVTGEPRTASVESLEETVLLALPKEVFERVIGNHPGVSLRLLKQVSNWLVRDEKALERAARRELQPPTLSWIDFAGLVLLSFFCAFVFNATNPNGIKLLPETWTEEAVEKVQPAAVAEAYHKGEVIVLDARPAAFFEAAHVKGALNVPLAIFDIMYTMALGDVDKERNVLVYGRTISSLYDEQLARKLVLRGHKQVSILAGGLRAWKAAGYPVEP